MNTTELENVLRQAPKPRPPQGLKERIMAETEQSTRSDGGYRYSPGPASWLRRWWPIIAPATASLACAVLCGLQQLEINDLKKTLQALPQIVGVANQALASSKPVAEGNPANESVDIQTEIARLRERAATLVEEIKQLERMRLENGSLRKQLAAAQTGLSVEETEALAQAKERAQCITCVNNMKQLGLAVRVWATDNKDMTPPDFLTMTNELSTPKILVCPADTAHQAAVDWASFTAANLSYEYLSPSSADAITEPQRIMFRCAIHGNITLCDGSVQMKVAKDHPEALITRNGKLFFELRPKPSPVSNNAPEETADPQNP